MREKKSHIDQPAGAQPEAAASQAAASSAGRRPYHPPHFYEMGLLKDTASGQFTGQPEDAYFRPSP